MSEGLPHRRLPPVGEERIPAERGLPHWLPRPGFVTCCRGATALAPPVRGSMSPGRARATALAPAPGLRHILPKGYRIGSPRPRKYESRLSAGYRIHRPRRATASSGSLRARKYGSRALASSHFTDGLPHQAAPPGQGSVSPGRARATASSGSRALASSHFTEGLPHQAAPPGQGSMSPGRARATASSGSRARALSPFAEGLAHQAAPPGRGSSLHQFVHL